MSRVGIGKWDVVLSADATALLGSLDRINGRMQRAETTMARHATAITTSFARIGKGIMAAQTLFIGWAGVVVGSRLIRWFAQASEEVDQLGKAAKRLGLTSEELSALKFATGEAGIEFDQLAKMIGKAGRAVAELVNRGNTIAQIGSVNVRLAEADGRVRSITDLLPDLARGIESAGSQAEQLRLAEKFFGRGGGEAFVTFLKESGTFVAGLADGMERARRLGVVFSEQQVARLTAMNDAIGRVDQSLLGIRVRILEQISPAVTDVANQVASAIAAAPEILGRLSDAISEAFSAEGGPLADQLQVVLQDLGEVGKAGVELGIRVAFGVAMDMLGLVWPALQVETKRGLEFAIYDSTVWVAKRAAGVLEALVGDAAGTITARITDATTTVRNALQAAAAVEEDIFAPLTNGETSLRWEREWMRGSMRLSTAFGQLTGDADELLGITDALAAHAMTGFEAAQDGAKDTTVEVDELTKRLIEFGDESQKAISGFSGGFARELADLAVDGKASFDELYKSWVKTLLAMAAQKIALDPFFDSLGAGFGSVFGSAPQAKGPLATGYVPVSAHGNAWNGSRRAAHGIIDRPTYLPQLDTIAGEANRSEVAIAPLQRIGSDLGVKAVPATVAVQIIDQRGSGERPSVSESTGPDGRKILKVLIRDEVNGMMQDGSADRVMSSQYGLRRRGARR